MKGAVTFDFWDTIVVDDSDEPKRAAKGLPPKARAREALFINEILAHHPHLGPRFVTSAFVHANERFRHHWKVEHRTPSVGDRLREGLAYLEVGETPGFADMVGQYEALEVECAPDLADGIQDCLEALSGRYGLGIISDAIVTPGKGLRQILKEYGLLHYFQHTVFSDEAGAAKPAARVFELACEGLDCAPQNLVHVGDREANDIAGPVAYGARSVLYTGVIDRGTSQTTEADAVCTHLRELPAIVDRLLS